MAQPTVMFFSEFLDETVAEKHMVARQQRLELDHFPMQSLLEPVFDFLSGNFSNIFSLRMPNWS